MAHQHLGDYKRIGALCLRWAENDPSLWREHVEGGSITHDPLYTYFVQVVTAADPSHLVQATKLHMEKGDIDAALLALQALRTWCLDVREETSHSTDIATNWDPDNGDDSVIFDILEQRIGKDAARDLKDLESKARAAARARAVVGFAPDLVEGSPEEVVQGATTTIRTVHTTLAALEEIASVGRFLGPQEADHALQRKQDSLPAEVFERLTTSTSGSLSELLATERATVLRQELEALRAIGSVVKPATDRPGPGRSARVHDGWLRACRTAADLFDHQRDGAVGSTSDWSRALSHEAQGTCVGLQ